MLKVEIFVGTSLTFPIKVLLVKKLLCKQTRHTRLLNCPPSLAFKVSELSQVTLDPSSHFRPQCFKKTNQNQATPKLTKKETPNQPTNKTPPKNQKSN